MNKKNKLTIAFTLVVVSMLACTLPTSQQPVTETPDLAATLTAIPTFEESPTPIPPTATVCQPTVTTTQDSNVRKGPSQVYDKLGYLPQGASAPVAGKSSDGTWWYIQFASGENGYGWISGSIVTTTCIPTTLAVVAAPPIPVSQPKHTKTPKPSNNNNHNNNNNTTTATPTQTQPSNPGELLFKVDFDSVWYCGGQARVSAKIYNIGTAPIESVMYSVEANGLYINGGTINNSPFESTATEPEPNCAQDVGHGQGSLAPGANAFIPIIISSVPAAGTQGFLYVESCTDNNRKGTCTGQFVYFTF
ncbi:MAG: hypothetical protein JETCAE01_02950 [Anaerolineaceae bacterium]|nr:MAG: hypothetical protein JETCAE01_02950 [Anaerolineaceae bacterium]